VPTQPLKVFVSYRRNDRPGHAGRLGDALRRALGSDGVFYDVATLRGGADFAVAIKRAIEQADVVAVVIGPDWSRRRVLDRLLSRPDWTRFEIAYARQVRKRILPILVGGAEMPRALPSGMAFLSTIHAVALRDESWDPDVEDLLTHLPAFAAADVAVGQDAPERPAALVRRPLVMASAAVVVVSGAWWGPYLWNGPPAPGPEPPVAPAVSPPNRPPTTGTVDVAIAGADGFSLGNRVGLMSATKFVLTAKGITDPDGDTLQYIWDFGDGSPSPRSSATVEKTYERVRRFQVKLFVNDGKLADDLLAAETDITVRDVTGTWDLSLSPDPDAAYAIPSRYVVRLVQQGDQLTGSILPAGANRGTVLIGHVKHPTWVTFGSEHAWWNDETDSYFELYVSDGAAYIQMRNRTPKKCGTNIPCLGVVANKQQ